MQELKINEKFDTGKSVRHRVHPGHQLELFLRTQPTVTLDNCEIFVRVQSAAVLGGPYDHISWSREYYDRRDMANIHLVLSLITSMYYHSYRSTIPHDVMCTKPCHLYSQ